MNGASIGLDAQKKDTVLIRKKTRFLYQFIKRLFDILVSGLSLIIFSPIYLLIVILIRIDSKGKAFYKHKRIGKQGEPIYLYKFRSMYSDSEERLEKMLKDPEIRKEWEENFKLENDPRITKVGKMLRRTSLDELPQLINILRGEMSIVGPRPVIESEIEKYGEEKEKFLSVIPGLTGWWACNGRSCTSYEDRKKLELYYVEHRSISLDLKIMFKTFISVIKGNGAK